jgi:predicted kinase
MDLAYRGHAALGEHFLAFYAEARDDFDLYGVVDYFQAYRAVVRAKVASLAARDAGIDASQRAAAIGSTGSHLDLARRMLEPQPPGALVLLGGIVGTGKSTAARGLARRLDVPVVASDQVRKRLPDLAHAGGRSDNVDAGLYSPELRRRVYSEVLLRAQAVIGSGRTVILDATWSTAREREAAGELARRFGTSLVFVETRCSAEEARRRLRRREAQGGDASDAGEAFHATSAARFEPWSDAEPGRHHVLPTDGADWERGLDPLVDSLSRR